MIRHIQSPGIAITVFQAFSRIFRYIQGYWSIFSHTHRCTTKDERGASPALFENQKKCPDFGKKSPDCVCFWLKFPIQNIVLRVSRRKNSNIFLFGTLFSWFFDVIFIKVILFHKHSHLPTPNLPPTPPPPLLPWKGSGYAPALIYYSFCKTLHLKCLTVFWIQLCLDSCSVICTVTLCYELHKTHSEFSHIQISVFSGICRHSQSYSVLLRHIHAYWHIIKVYSGLFRHIRCPV